MLAIALLAASLGPPPIDSAADLEFVDPRYLVRSLADFGPKQAYVLIFSTTTCPVAGQYAPELVRLEAEYRARGVQFLLLDVGPSVAVREVAAWALERGLGFAVGDDPEAAGATRLGVTRTPEVIVLDGRREVCYRGRIDDRFAPGAVRARVSRPDLAEALEDVLAGRAVRVPRTTPAGCKLPRPTLPDPGRPVTYSADVAPILRRHCQGCHAIGGDAPFPLATYADAVQHAEMIAEVVGHERMPPWSAATTSEASFINARAMDEAERAILIAWTRSGMARGEHIAATPPGAPRGAWRIEAPDLVLKAPFAHDVPASGTMPYKYVVLPYLFAHDTWVEQIEITADNPRVLHHANLAYFRFGSKFAAENFLTGKVPGGDPMALDPGTAALIPAGSVIGLQVHYVATGKPERCRLAVGLRYPRAVVRKQLRHAQVGTGRFAIPPHDPHHEVSARRTLDHDSTGIGLFSHMHLRGKDMTFRLVPPAGDPRTLLVIPNYHFDWQHSYRFEPGRVRLPAGSRLEVTAHFDNSEINPFNPDPAATVRYGQQTEDEMMIGFWFFTRDAEDLKLSIDPETGRGVGTAKGIDGPK